MRLGLLKTVALAAVLLVPAHARAEETSQPLANTCQGSPVPKTRLAACEALMHEPDLTAKLSAPVYFSAAMAELDLRAPDKALGNLNTALELDPAFWPASWVRADLLHARHDFADARRDWSQVVAEQPGLVDAYDRLGWATVNLGQADEAIGDFTKAITAASPAEPVAKYYDGRAFANLAAGRLDAAIADYDEAVKHAAGDAWNYAGRGRVRFLKGDAAASLGDFRKAVELDPASIYDALWLYLAETAAGEDGADGLRGRVGQLPLAEWPGPIVRVLLGEAKPEEIQAKTTVPAAWSAADRQAGADCELGFYLGEFYRLHGQKDRAAASFRAALATHAQEYIEYVAARSELKQIGP